MFSTILERFASIVKNLYISDMNLLVDFCMFSFMYDFSDAGMAEQQPGVLQGRLHPQKEDQQFH